MKRLWYELDTLTHTLYIIWVLSEWDIGIEEWTWGGKEQRESDSNLRLVLSRLTALVCVCVSVCV